MKNKLSLWSVLILVLSVNFAFAQSVSGVVSDAASGEPLPGVAVAKKGTNNAELTDFDGKFSLELKGEIPVILVVSYVGYSDQEIEVRDADQKIKINLKLINMAKVSIKPLADRVLIEPMEAETKTASGIIIPDNAKEKPQKGNVVAVGTGTKDEPLTVKVGDTVLYGKYGGTELKLEGKDYLIMRESDILAIV